MQPPARNGFPLHRRQYSYVFAGYIIAAVLSATAGALAAPVNPASTKTGGALLYAVAVTVCLYCSAWVAADVSERVNRRVGWNTDDLGPPMSRGRAIFLVGCAFYLAALMAVWILTTVVFVLVPIVLFRS